MMEQIVIGDIKDYLKLSKDDLDERLESLIKDVKVYCQQVLELDLQLPESKRSWIRAAQKKLEDAFRVSQALVIQGSTTYEVM